MNLPFLAIGLGQYKPDILDLGRLILVGKCELEIVAFSLEPQLSQFRGILCHGSTQRIPNIHQLALRAFQVAPSVIQIGFYRERPGFYASDFGVDLADLASRLRLWPPGPGLQPGRNRLWLPGPVTIRVLFSALRPESAGRFSSVRLWCFRPASWVPAISVFRFEIWLERDASPSL